MKRLLSVLFVAVALFAVANTASANVTVYNNTNCKYLVEIVFGLTPCNDIASTIIISYPNTNTVVPCPPGAVMYKAAATESQSGQTCAVYDPTCDPQQICGTFGVCNAFFGYSSPTALKIVL